MMKRFLDNPIVYLFLKMWKYSKGNRKAVVLYIILSVLSNIVWLFWPFVIAHVFNIIQAEGVSSANFFTIISYLSLLILFTTVGWLFHGPSRVIEVKNAFKVKANYKMKLLNGVMGLSAEWHTDHHSGDTIDKIEKGSNAMHEFSRQSFELIAKVIEFFGSVILLAYFSPTSILVVVFVSTLAMFIIFRFDKILVSQWGRLHRKDNQISSKVYDVISNITTVIILRIEDLVSKSMSKKIYEPYELTSKNAVLNEWKWALVSFSGPVMVVIVMAIYIWGEISIGQTILYGTVFLLYEYIKKIENVFFSAAWLYGQKLEQKTAVQNAEILAKEFVKKEIRNEIKMKEGWNSVEIKNLHFSYHGENSKEVHLKNINLEIKKGEKIAFVGESGSGKTTLMKLIRALYLPQKGKIILDGDILSHGFNSISSDIALIPQDPEIFSSTIKENITLGIRRTLGEIEKFTDMAEITSTINKLPKKLNSSIVEKGVNLSGGQKQRLALARGLMASKDKKIILLDEPTSSVDSKNEKKIYQNIFQSFEGKTIISSIHRFHLLPLFDTIYIYSDGKMIASGSFDNLLTSSEYFYDMWSKYSKVHDGNKNN